MCADVPAGSSSWRGCVEVLAKSISNVFSNLSGST